MRRVKAEKAKVRKTEVERAESGKGRSGKGQMSDTYRIGILLAVAGGYLDAYTYLCRGHVFANAQTGNLVLLGIKLMERDWLNACYYLFPILAFVAGIFVAEEIKRRHRFNTSIHWRQIVLMIEVAALVVVSFLPLGKWDPLANIIVSFVSSLQVETFRKINGNSCATTMCTGNLRSGSELLCRYLMKGDRKELRDGVQYYGIIVFFVVGAVLGGLLTEMLKGRAVLAAAAGLTAAFLMMHSWVRERA